MTATTYAPTRDDLDITGHFTAGYRLGWDACYPIAFAHGSDEAYERIQSAITEDGKGKLELINVDSGAVGRATFEPGWQWSKHVKPIAGTDSCQAPHMGYVISGRIKIVMDDGDEMEFGSGDFMTAAPGHDAWTLGDEPCVIIDWQGYADYAKRQN